MSRILLFLVLLVTSATSLAAESATGDFSAASESFKESSKKEFGVSFFALIELVQRSIDGYDFVSSAETDESWPYLQELAHAGYMDISVQDGMGGYAMDRKVYKFHPTPKGNALREALLRKP
jgi:hypothetical protein